MTSQQGTEISVEKIQTNIRATFVNVFSEVRELEFPEWIEYEINDILKRHLEKLLESSNK